MKKILAMLSLAFCATVHAQHADWKMVSVSDKAQTEPVGFMYHAYAMGTLTDQGDSVKVISGLRFVCSRTTPEQPEIILYWQRMEGAGKVQVTVDVDGKILPVSTWNHQHEILHRKINESKQLFKRLSTAKLAKFTWAVDGVNHSVAFDMTDFNSQLPVFKTRCNLP